MSVLGMVERSTVENHCQRLMPETGGLCQKPAGKVHIYAGLWLEPAMIYHCQFTAGSSHKLAVMWTFTAVF